MQNLILYNWVIQKTRTMTILSGAEILKGAQGCERTSASALSKQTSEQAKDNMKVKDLISKFCNRKNHLLSLLRIQKVNFI
jgi:hypothetical protein